MAKTSKEIEDDKYRKPKSNRYDANKGLVLWSLDIGRYRLPLGAVALILSILVVYLITHPLRKSADPVRTLASIATAFLID
eukprot:8519750-Pyramimonas_sp.AAC.1